MHITIIGNGQIGNAILHLLNEAQKNTKKNYSINIYDTDHIKNISCKSLKECVMDVDFIFFCIPSWHLEKMLKEISFYVKPKTILISLSKGIDAISKNSVDELFEKNIKKRRYALISGPMFAQEIINNKMSFAILATKEKRDFTKISGLFVNTKLKLEYSSKVHSIAISGVLKNIYTLIISIIDNSQNDNNIKGFLITKAIKEMSEIMETLKLDKKVIFGTAGLADLIATASSEHSQNRKVGTEIAKSGTTKLNSEGLMSVASISKRINKKTKKLRMFRLLEKIIKEKKNPKEKIEKFLKEI